MRLTVPLRLRWSDIDAYAHVNNAAMLGLLEEARIQAFWQAGDGAAGPAVLGGLGSETLTLVAHQEVEYLLPIPYRREPVHCEIWLGRLGGSSLDVSYEVFLPEAEGRVLATRAATTVVLVDAATQRPRRITEPERAAWTPYIEPPVAFTRRR